MELTDIPSLAVKVFRYSASTRAYWALSVFLVLSFTLFVSDLLYSFIYNRIYNVATTLYDNNYWIIISILGISTTLFHVSYSLLLYQVKMTRFIEKQGVGILPFDIISINPETLISFEKIRTLDEVMHQLFLAIDLVLDNDEYNDLFECRVLPYGLNVHNQKTSKELRDRLDALLIIRGILKQDDEGLSLDLFFHGTKLDLSETILLRKDAIDAIAKMIMISSYVALSFDLKFKAEKDHDDEKLKQIKSHLTKSITMYDEISNYRLDSPLRQNIEDLLNSLK